MFEADAYTVRQRLTADGTEYEVYEAGDLVLAWTKRKYRLAEEFSLTTPGGEPVLRVTAENVVDVPTGVDVGFTAIDERSGDVMGLIKRDWGTVAGARWDLLDPAGRDLAAVEERSAARSIARRYLLRAIPYRYAIRSPGGEGIGRLRRRIPPGGDYVLDLSDDEEGVLDRRLAVAASVAIDAFETA